MRYVTPGLLTLCLLLGALPASADKQDDDTRAEAARINVRLGVEYMKQGQLATAREKIEKALEQNPRDPSVQFGAGLLYEQLREPEKAERHYRQALRLEPDNPDAQNALGAFLCRNGQPAKGEAAFVEAAENPLYRTPEVAFTNAGVCARRAGRLAEAEAHVRRALAQPAIYPEALIQMAGISYERANYLQARAFLQRYLDAAPGTAAVLLLGHQIERALADQVAAKEYAVRLRTQFPESPEARILADLEREAAE